MKCRKIGWSDAGRYAVRYAWVIQDERLGLCLMGAKTFEIESGKGKSFGAKNGGRARRDHTIERKSVYVIKFSE